MIPDLDSQIGITEYSTKFNGIGGRIRVNIDDFEVDRKSTRLNSSHRQ